MKKHYQKESYPFGDCFRTCMASILESDKLEDVPNFMKDGEELFNDNLSMWLKENNLQSLTVDWEGLNKFNTILTSKVYIIATGKNNGIFHSVVGTYTKEDERHLISLVHDPIEGQNFFNSDEDNMGIIQIRFIFGNENFKCLGSRAKHRLKSKSSL